MFRKKLKKHISSFKWLLSYLCIFLVVTCATGYTYFQAQTIAKDNIEQYTLEMLTNARNLADSRLENVKRDIMKIASHHLTRRILNMDDPTLDSQMYTFKEYMSLLNTIDTPDDVYADFFLYSDRNGYVISSANGAMDIADYFRLNYPGRSDEDYKNWKAGRIQCISKGKLYPAETVCLNGKNSLVIPQTISVPLESKKKYQGSINALLLSDALFAGFADNGLSGSRFVLDGSSQPIAVLAGKGSAIHELDLPDSPSGFYIQQLAGKKNIIVYARSLSSDLIFVEVAPYSLVMNQVSQVRTMFFIAVLVCLFLCALISGIFIRRNVPPIAKLHEILSNTIGDENGHKSTAEYIQDSVQKILSENQTMQDSLQQQMVLIKASYLNRLLISGLEDEELALALPHINLNCGENYGVIILRMGPAVPSEAYLRKLTIRQLLEPAADQIEIADVGADRLALVLSFSSRDSELCMKTADHMIQRLKKELLPYQIYLNAFGGPLCRKPAELPYAYSMADQISQKSLYDGETPVTWYQNQTIDEEIFFYPVEIEQLMLSNIRNGNLTQAAKTFKNIIQKNFQAAKINSSLEQLLISRIKATLLLAIDDVYSNTEKRVDAINSVITLPEPIPRESFEQFCIELIEGLCERVNKRKIENENELIQNIIQFIEKNYTNSEMSLLLVASQFQMSDSYLSTYFKKQTGENFVNYIEKKRLELSCEYLKAEKHTIEEISAMVGYTSVHSFRRAFKRHYGLTPTAYVEHQRETE